MGTTIRGMCLGQSTGQFSWVSEPWHLPSPHSIGQLPQSSGQVLQVSLPLHLLSPHLCFLHSSQSFGQVLQVSLPLHLPSPHSGLGHSPQSLGQLEHVSPRDGSHLPSPHFGFSHSPQSSGQLLQFSGGSHLSSPHTGGHLPQSALHVLQSSSGGLHSPSPQDGISSGGGVRHTPWLHTSPTSHEPHWILARPVGSHGSFHSPHSLLRIWQVLPMKQMPSVWTGLQSRGHEPSSSDVWHLPSPQNSPRSVCLDGRRKRSNRASSSRMVLIALWIRSRVILL